MKYLGIDIGSTWTKGALFAATKDFNVVSAECNQLGVLRRLSGPRLVEVDVSSGGPECP